MDDSQKYRSGLVVFFGNIFLYNFGKRGIPRFVALHNIARAFVYNNQVIVLKKNLKIVFGAMRAEVYGLRSLKVYGKNYYLIPLLGVRGLNSVHCRSENRHFSHRYYTV